MTTELSQRLRAARVALTPAITQRDVAKRLALSPSAVNLWESGKTEPSATALAELAAWYDVSTDWLLGVESKTPMRQQQKTATPLWTVPIVQPPSLVRWHWEEPTELLQTAVAYPAQTAAAILVTSDAISSTCPMGSYAVISKGHKIESGQIVMALIGKSAEPVLRKYVREGSDTLLIADDTRYPSHRLDDGVKIIGRVTEIIVRRTLS